MDTMSKFVEASFTLRMLVAGKVSISVAKFVKKKERMTFTVTYCNTMNKHKSQY